MFFELCYAFVLLLRCPSGCSGQPFGAGGWETQAHFMYGTASFAAMVSAEVGAWTEIFLYNNQGGPNEGITFQFIGINCYISLFISSLVPKSKKSGAEIYTLHKKSHIYGTDFCEKIGQDPSSVKIMFYANSQYYEFGNVALGFNYNQAYHVYSINRSATQLIFLVDGKQVLEEWRGMGKR
jgi:beta-glucanase (GH16 family)